MRYFSKKGIIQKPDAALVVLWLGIWIFLGLFVLYPLARLIYLVFFADGKLSLAILSKVFGSWYNKKAFVNSMILASAVGFGGTALGFLFAFSVTRIELPKIVKWFLRAIIVLPFVSPPFTSSIALTMVLGPNGLLLKLLHMPDFNIYGFLGTWIAETLTYFPVAFLTLTTVLEAIDPNLEDAAMSMGSTPWQAFCTVTLPLSIPGLANSFLLLFGSSLADFATPLVMAGHTFPVLTTQAYMQITGMYDMQGGAAISFALLVPALIVYLLQHYWVESRYYVTVSGKAGARSKPKGAGTFAEVVMLAVISLISLFIIFLYSIIFLGSLIKVWGVDNSLTLENYVYVFTVGRKAVKDTVTIALVSTVIGGAVGVVIGYLVNRHELPGRKALEFVSLLNYVLPGTVVGIAYAIAFSSGPIMLTGTMAIIVALCVSRYDATGIRATTATLKQIDTSLEEASLNLGASKLTTFRKVTVPLITPAIITGTQYLFVVSMTAISATIFLVSVRWSLLTVRILECITELLFAQAAAFSVVLILIVAMAMWVIRLLFEALYPNLKWQRGI
ncbi:MAG TPA: iron ABC transporter permease [Acetomicrobium flavidum]|uniref:ABC transporter permease n=1 Tax=Acetomicrobium flavidum TaxID=49896 RepID=UPI002BDB042A|nr:iron ABC transporter permease [Acetomicrobium flavidum]